LYQLMFKLIDQAHAQGWNATGDKTTEDVFIAGHSLGCAGARAFMIYHPGYAGLMCFGTQANATDLYNPKAPLLMFTGELDGLSATEFTPFYKNYLDAVNKEGELKALQTRSTIVVPKMSHSDFCPGFDVATDCWSELTVSEALNIIGTVASTWLALQTETDQTRLAQAKATMLDFTKQTDELLQPFMALSAIETNGMESKWCETAQVMISGLTQADAPRLNVQNNVYVGESLPTLEHCHTNYSVDASTKTMSVKTCSQCSYKSSFFKPSKSAAAYSLGCKMVSTDRVEQQLHVNTTGKTCMDVNVAAFALAQKYALDTTKARYQKKGKQMTFLPDKFKTIGPVWVLSDLDINTKGDVAKVTSIALNSPVTSKIFPGNHYCKLLSPAYALQWMMTDSLPKRGDKK